MDWFDQEFKKNLGVRYKTMKKALEIFTENKGKIILETGTTRMANDWGAGYSTVVFGEWIRRNGGAIITVDISKENIEFCKTVTALYSNRIEYAVSDSLDYLKNYQGDIDFLYLDSFDYPYGELLEIYGGKENIEQAEAKLRELNDEEIIKLHGDVIIPSQKHQLRELKLAIKRMKKGTPILLDDCNLPGGGKGRLTKDYLANIGATCILDEYQSLWTL